MTQYSHYAPMPVPNQAMSSYEELDTSAESRFPSLLGFVTAFYLVAVVTMSTASESTAWVPQVVGIFLGICWVGIGVFAKAQPLAWSRPITLFALFTAWAGTGVLVTSSGDYYWNIYSTSLKVAAVTLITLQCVRTRQDLLVCNLFLGVACLVILYQGIDTIMRSIEYTGAIEKKGARAEGLLISNANDMAEFGIVVAIGSVICIIGYKNLILKAIATLAITAALYMVAASGSRMGMVGLLIASVCTYWYHFRSAAHGQIIKRLILIFLGLSMLGGTVYFVVNSPFFFRLARVASSTEAAQDEPRFQLFIAAMGATIDHPIFGLGLGGFAMNRLGTTRTGEMMISHSTISETLSCTGIPGFLFYFGSRLALYLLIRRTRMLPLTQYDRGVVNMAFPFFWVLCLFDLVAMTYQHRLIWPILGTLCGYLWNLNRQHRSDTVAALI